MIINSQDPDEMAHLAVSHLVLHGWHFPIYIVICLIIRFIITDCIVYKHVHCTVCTVLV